MGTFRPVGWFFASPLAVGAEPAALVIAGNPGAVPGARRISVDRLDAPTRTALQTAVDALIGRLNSAPSQAAIVYFGGEVNSGGGGRTWVVADGTCPSQRLFDALRLAAGHPSLVLVDGVIRSPTNRSLGVVSALCPEDHQPTPPRPRADRGRVLLGTAPVTQGEFALFVQATGYVTSSEILGGLVEWRDEDQTWSRRPGDSWKTFPDRGSDANAVSGVSWLDAVAYRHWLSQTLGLAPVYRLDGDPNLASGPEGWNTNAGAPGLDREWSSSRLTLGTRPENHRNPIEYPATAAYPYRGFRLARTP